MELVLLLCFILPVSISCYRVFCLWHEWIVNGRAPLLWFFIISRRKKDEVILHILLCLSRTEFLKLMLSTLFSDVEQRCCWFCYYYSWNYHQLGIQSSCLE